MSKKTKTNKDLTLAEQAALQQQAKDASVATQLKDTVAGQIWNEIKDKNIEMFALPNQVIGMHCHPIAVEPSRLFLVANSTAVLPSLEMAVGNKYTVEQADRFIIVARAPANPLLKK